MLLPKNAYTTEFAVNAKQECNCSCVDRVKKGLGIFSVGVTLGMRRYFQFWGHVEFIKHNNLVIECEYLWIGDLGTRWNTEECILAVEIEVTHCDMYF
jgi:hypothetical protein